MRNRRLSWAEGLAVWLGISANAVLFAAKIVVGISFNSIAIISDSFNSLTDIVASTIVLISIRSSYLAPDAKHPYGHKRAQPIASLIVAILTCIVGFEIIAQSVTRLLDAQEIALGTLPMFLLAGVMAIKLALYLFVRVTALRTGSTALMASAADHRNDVLVSLAVLVGVGFSNLGLPVFDPIAAILVGAWIIRAGFEIGRSNLKYLMGEAPPADLVKRVTECAKAVEGVLGLNDVLAHYVGTSVQIEVHIYVDRRLNIEAAHTIGKEVQRGIEEMGEVSRAFIHIDPIEGG